MPKPVRSSQGSSSQDEPEAPTSGDPEASLLFQVLNGPVGGTRQMPVGAVLPAEELERVRSWIEAGALDN